MPSSVPAPSARAARAGPDPPSRLGCRVRLADGRVFTGALAPERHRALQLGLLHSASDGLVELAAGVRRDGDLRITTRERRDHFQPGGSSGQPDWLRDLLELAGRHADQGHEVFIAPAVRSEPLGAKRAVAHTRWLWVDVDQPGQLPALWALLAERPCHLLVETAGSGGVHAYWQLDQPLEATHAAKTGELVEPIERAHLRLIHHLGTGPDGKPNVADPQVKDRSRLLRLSGSVNLKTGKFARILEADFALPAYPVRALVGDLPDPAPAVSPAGRRPGSRVAHRDPYKQISPPEYFERLAGITVPRSVLVACPAHEDRHPSCSVGTDPTQGWCCHAASCGARGAIYDLASVLLGGPYGRELRGDAFTRARAYVADVFGDLT